MAWIPTDEEVAYFKALNRDNSKDDDYYKAMLPLLLEMVNKRYNQRFKPDKLPADVKLFLAKATEFFKMQQGLKARRMDDVSYTYEISELPKSITNLLINYRKVKTHRIR